MTTTIKSFMSFIICMVMAQPYAMANTHAVQMNTADKIELLKNSNAKTVGELWVVMKPHMHSDLQKRYETFLKPFFNAKLPKMKFGKDRIEFLNRGKVVTMWTNTADDGSLRVNKKLIFHDYASDPKAMTEEIQKAVNNYSLWETLILPKAHAFEFSWISALIGALGGWLLSMWYSPSEAYSDVKGLF